MDLFSQSSLLLAYSRADNQFGPNFIVGGDKNMLLARTCGLFGLRRECEVNTPTFPVSSTTFKWELA